MQYMRFKDHLNKNPIPKFQQKLNNFEKPQNFQKPQNLGLNAWIIREKEIIPSDLKQGKAENHVGLKVLGDKWVFGRWGDKSVKREIKKSEREIEKNST